MSNSASATSFVSAARELEWAQVDVFAERPLEGNALAVFSDARGLTSETMQALARETNLSETTFILPREAEVERERGVQVRIFLTSGEVPFAGHPTLGTASWLYQNHPVLRGAEEITLDLGVGPIPVRFKHPLAGEDGVFGTMRQKDPTFGEIVSSDEDRATVAESLGLAVEDLDTELPIQMVTTGLAFCVVPLRSLEAAGRVRFSMELARPLLQRVGARYFYCMTRAGAGSGADWHARMQFGRGEDPATGSAAGCAASWLVRHGAVESGAEVVIEQGVEMLRPSRIHVSASAEGDDVRKVFVGGRTISVAKGRFFLP